MIKYVLAAVIIYFACFSDNSHSSGVAVTPDGRMFIQGPIVEELVVEVVYLLKTNNVHSVWLSSFGGNALTGIAIGYMVHDLKLDTVAFGGCYSSCSFIWLAGKTRSTMPDVHVYAHGVYMPDGSSMTGENIVIWSRVLTAYFNEVNPAMTDKMLSYMSLPVDEFVKVN